VPVGEAVELSLVQACHTEDPGALFRKRGKLLAWNRNLDQTVRYLWVRIEAALDLGWELHYGPQVSVQEMS